MSLRRVQLAAPLLLIAAASSAGAQAAKAPARSAPESTVVTQERALYDAFAKHDATAFNRELGSDFVFVDRNGVTVWKRAETANMMKGCTLATWAMDDVRTTRSGSGVMVVTYTWTGDEVCNGHRSPSPVIATSVWRRLGSRWVAVSHNEVPPAPKS